jgi:hypothetical protein
MTQADHLLYAEQPCRDLVVSIRSVKPDDLRFVGTSWKESHKDAPGPDRMPWSIYKQTTCKQIDALTDSQGTRILVAAVPDGRIAGWICYSPGKAISTVHWVYTRHKLDADKLRRRGVMTALLEAASLGKRFAYTFRGPRHRRSDTPTDERIVDWLRSRGVTAVYCPLAEWLA